jgi:nucleoside 2-deoxyribosyltransferase
MRVYLCGAINGKTDAECKWWRDAASELLRNLGHEPLDPMARDYRGVEASAWREIVDGDLKDIDSSAAILAKVDSPSWGTAMEIFYANRKGVPVVGFAAGPRPSPWLLAHTYRLVDSVDQAVAVLDQHLRPSPVSPRGGADE